jgi:hypothetical protein
MAYDWINASPEARRLLYRTSKQIVDRHYAGHWSRFYEAVFDRGGVPGTGYEDNFRAGRVSRIKANAIHRWISIHHTQAAIALDSAVTALPDAVTIEDSWQSFVDAHGQYGALEIVTIDELSIVGFACEKIGDAYRIKLGEAFCFRLTSEHSGAALAFQQAKGVWYALPLRQAALEVEVARGTQIVPRDGDMPMPLSEDSDTGLYRFVMIIGAAHVIARAAQTLSIGLAIASDQLSDVIDALTQGDISFAVHCCDAMIM